MLEPENTDLSDTVTLFKSNSDRLPEAFLGDEYQELFHSPSMLLHSGGESVANRPSDLTTPFSEILEQIIPTDLVESHDKSKKSSLPQRLKKAGKSGWLVLRQVLKVVKETSSLFPPLESTLSALFALLEPLETKADVNDSLIRLSKELCTLQLIIAPYRGHEAQVTEKVKARFGEIAGWLKHLEPWIERKRSRPWIERYVFSKEDETEVNDFVKVLSLLIEMLQLDATLSIENYTALMNEKVDVVFEEKLLDPLRPVSRAIYKAQAGDRCLPGTRKAVLNKLISWCHETERPHVFWLSGVSGTGKSAISRTFCDTLHRSSLLGGSFFCSRLGSDKRNDVSRILPTLAHSLAYYNERYRLNLLETLKKDTRIGDFTLDRQLEGLIIRPAGAHSVFKEGRRMPVLVIDALDECTDDDTKRFLGALLSQAATGFLPFKFLVTSRPENHIRQEFNLDSQNHVICSLHDIEKDMIDDDIYRFIHHRLERTKQKDRSFFFTEDDVAALTGRADRLFIYAFTACNYIDDDPQGGLQRLKYYSESATGVIQSGIDDMYSLVLNKALDPKGRDDKIINNTEKILVYLVTAQTTFSISELAALIRCTTHDVRTSLKLLYSLIFIPSDDEQGFFLTLHASFGDYLGNSQRSHVHFIDLTRGHEIFTDLCWRLISELRFNIAGFTTSYKENEEQDYLAIPRRLAYVSQYWVYHLARTADPLRYIDQIEHIFLPRFLFWLEVMSIEQKTDMVPDLLQRLLPIVKVFL